MSEKKKPFPDIPVDPLEALEMPLEGLKAFDEILSNFGDAVSAIDRGLDEVQKRVSQIDGKFTMLPTRRDIESIERLEPKRSAHLSFEGQSNVDYCLECCEKHSQTAKVLMREALQRAQADGPDSAGVIEKVRGVIEELSGYEDDTTTVDNENVSELNSLSRTLRKYIYGTRATIGQASVEDLGDIKGMIDGLVDVTYKVIEQEEGECIGCTTENICGGDIECVEFVDDATRHIDDPKKIEKVLKEARRKYGRD